MSYTRLQLQRLLGITRSKLRRALAKLQVVPSHQQPNEKCLPVFYYQNDALKVLTEFIQAQKQKRLKQTKKCCVCKKQFLKIEMIDNRCAECYVQKCCKPILYGKDVWSRAVNSKLVQAAVKYLSSF